jgi:predicted transposase/invertase (TIGR01784 family)
MGMRKTDKLLELQFAQEKGLKEGIEKGEYKKSIETAKNLLSMGLTIEQISKATGLSLDDIEKLNLDIM